VSDEVIGKVARGGRVGKLKVSGIAAKRRDRSTLTKRVQKGVAMSIVNQGNEARALLLVRRWITRLALYEIELEDFLITTELKNPKERVGFSVQPWVAVAWALEKKMRGSEPVRGERVPWLVVRTPDYTRVVPPESKRAFTSDFVLSGIRSAAQLHHYTLAQLLQSLHNFVSHIDPAEQQVYFGERNLLAMDETRTLASVGIMFGHRLTLCGKAGPTSKTAVSFRIKADDAGDDSVAGDSDADSDAEQEGEDGIEQPHPSSTRPSPPTARSGGTALAMMMFNAKDMTMAERKSMGKKRVESDSLSPFARHPQEIGTIKEVDVNIYMGHISQALAILLKETRPDLWSQIQVTLAKSKPLIDMSLGKARQGTLKGFFKPSAAKQ